MTQIEMILDKIATLEERVKKLEGRDDDMMVFENKSKTGFEDGVTDGKAFLNIKGSTGCQGKVYAADADDPELFSVNSTGSIGSKGEPFSIKTFSDVSIMKAEELISSAGHTVGRYVHPEDNGAHPLRISIAKLEAEWNMSASTGKEYEFWYEVYEVLQSKS